MSRLYPFMLCILALALLSACGTVSAPSLQGQIDEVRKLNTDLSSQWSDFDATMTATTSSIASFTQISVDPQQLDMALLKTALTECFEAPVSASLDASRSGSAATGVAAAPTCDTESTAALNDIKSKSEPPIASFIDSKLSAIALLRDNVKGKLPGLAESISLSYPEAKARAAALRESVDGLKSSTDALGLPESMMNKFDADYKTFVTELATLEEIVAKLEQESPNLQGKIATSLERATYNMTTFGDAQ